VIHPSLFESYYENLTGLKRPWGERSRERQLTWAGYEDLSRGNSEKSAGWEHHRPSIDEKNSGWKETFQKNMDEWVSEAIECGCFDPGARKGVGVAFIFPFKWLRSSWTKVLLP